VARLLVATYLIYAGLMLAIAPWTQFWVHNYFGQAWPWLGALMGSAYVRGGVTGVGLITMATGVRDLAGRLRARSASTPPDPNTTPL
jgi:hypothetical protein